MSAFDDYEFELGQDDPEFIIQQRLWLNQELERIQREREAKGGEGTTHDESEG